MKKKRLTTYAFVLPALFIYLSIIVIPIVYSLFISLHEWNGIGEKNFVGIQNYINLITADEIFFIAIKNNLIWIVLTIVFATSISLVLAVVLNNKFKGRAFFRGIYYFPCVVAPIAVSIIWQWMYDPNIGFFNSFFRLIGLNYFQQWLSTPDTSIFAIFGAALWRMIGQPMILFLAGLQAIPSDVLEAATVDGANAVQKFFRVMIPMLKESFFMVIATLVIDAVQVYDMVKGLTDGGPNNATQMMSTYMYLQTFRYNNVGYGTAIACLMVVLMLVVIIPYILFMTRDD